MGTGKSEEPAQCAFQKKLAWLSSDAEPAGFCARYQRPSNFLPFFGAPALMSQACVGLAPRTFREIKILCPGFFVFLASCKKKSLGGRA